MWMNAGKNAFSDTACDDSLALDCDDPADTLGLSAFVGCVDGGMSVACSLTCALDAGVSRACSTMLLREFDEANATDAGLAACVP
jgi:hypothetical protein